MPRPLDGPRLPPQSGTARQLVVFLHGYGADGNDLIDLGRSWADLLPDAAFVSPHAPEPCGMSPMGCLRIHEISPPQFTAGFQCRKTPNFASRNHCARVLYASGVSKNGSNSADRAGAESRARRGRSSTGSFMAGLLGGTDLRMFIFGTKARAYALLEGAYPGRRGCGCEEIFIRNS